MEGVGECEREREKGKARCHPDHHNTSLVSNTTKPHPATTTAAGGSAPCWKENAGKEKRTKITRGCAGRTDGREEPKPFCPTISPSLTLSSPRYKPGQGRRFRGLHSAGRRWRGRVSPYHHERERAKFWTWKI